MSSNWIANRTKCFDSSGIRRVFELGAKLTDPINLSIGQPNFDAPDKVRRAAIEAIESGKNGYSLTQGVPALREKLQSIVNTQYNHDDREVFVSSGTSGGLMLAMLTLINPGDEVIVFDPYFVMYDALVGLVGGKVVYVDTYPDFQVDPDRVASAITPRTKAIIFNSPNNPTGTVSSEATVKGIAHLAAERNIALISDEIYHAFCYDKEFISPAQFNDQTIVIDGFSKAYGITGWRLGFVHGPSEIVNQMTKLQQYSFVCAPHPFQLAGIIALDTDMSETIADYRHKRDMIVDGLSGDYELETPSGAFYAFPRVPWGTGTEFVERAITEHKLLIIPGNVFSHKDTHFRISYAAEDETIQRGINALKNLAKAG